MQEGPGSTTESLSPPVKPQLSVFALMFMVCTFEVVLIKFVRIITQYMENNESETDIPGDSDESNLASFINQLSVNINSTNNVSPKENSATMAKNKRRSRGRPWTDPSGETALLDLGFLELDVLARDGIVFGESELLRLGAGVLLGDVEKAGVGARQQLDLDGGGLGHRRNSV